MWVEWGLKNFQRLSYCNTQGAIGLKRTRGYTLLEMLVLLAVLGVVLSIAFINLRPLDSPIQNSLSLTSGFLRQVRAKAMATTSSYRVRFGSSQQATVEYAVSCGATTWTADSQVILQLPSEVQLNAPDWQTLVICFNARGLVDAGKTLTLRDNRGTSKQLELMLGGGVRSL